MIEARRVAGERRPLRSGTQRAEGAPLKGMRRA
jgi:hypothetical protein